MSDPILDPSDLGIYLSDADSINLERAAKMIEDAQALCESILTPLPAVAAVIVKRVAARGYVTMTSSRQYQLNAAGADFGTQPGPVGGVYLTRADKADLRRLSGGGVGAFSIDMLPATYTAELPWWGNGADTESLTDFDPIT